MATDDDIVLKIVIKGQDPGEIARLAQETTGRLAEESAKHIGKLTQLHKQAAQDQEDAAKRSADVVSKSGLSLERFLFILSQCVV